MITYEEIVGKINEDEIPDEHFKNIIELKEKVNKLRQAYGKPLIVSSGYRTLAKHLEIYAAKGIIDQSKIPMKSKHLSGQAVDFSDPKRLLQNWILANEDLVTSFGLWFEDFDYTKNWCHCQIVPPKSGKRFFVP